MARCSNVDTNGYRCGRPEHRDDVHDYGPPATIPPIWWEPKETSAFFRDLSLLIMHGIVAVEPPSAEEEQSPEFILGRLQIAARRFYEATESIFGYDDEDAVPQGVWTEFHDARDRVLKLTDNVRDWRAAAAALAARESVP